MTTQLQQAQLQPSAGDVSGGFSLSARRDSSRRVLAPYEPLAVVNFAIVQGPH